MMTTARVARRPWLIVSVLCVATLAAMPVLAQTSSDNPVPEGRAYVTIGWAATDLNELNGRLTGRGYPEFPESRLTLGLGAHGVRGRWLLGAEGQALVGSSKDATRAGQNYEVALNGGYGFFNVGYLALRRGHLHAYPFGGIGGGGVQLRINESSAPTFDDVLRAPGRSASLTTAGLLLQVGFAADQLFALRTRESRGQRHERGLVFGVRFGYVFMPVQSAWRLNSTRVGGGPDVGMGGPYVRFVVGGGGRRSAP